MRSFDEIGRFRMLMNAADYEDGYDADALRTDPLIKLAMDRLPDQDDLCLQSTVSRTENLPARHAPVRMGRAMVDHYCQSFLQVPASQRAGGCSRRKAAISIARRMFQRATDCDRSLAAHGYIHFQ